MSAEIETSEQPEEAPGLPATVPDPKLTLKQDRLAGSADCMNCGTALMGPFCHYCGQPDKNLMRFFPALLRELLEDFMDFDSRFMRTIKPLLFKPGKLTRDYLDGRRFRYVPPLRLYIFSSLVLFFLIAVFAVDSLQFQPNTAGDEPGLTIKMSEDDREDLQEALSELEKVNPGLAEELGSETGQAVAEAEGGTESESELEPEEESDEIDIDVNGKPWDAETNPVVLPLMPDWVNDWVNREIAESPKKGREIAENPNLMFDKVLDVLPGTMFVLLPLVALLLKFWYLFAKKYYVEHLIFALHNHAFIFVTFIAWLMFSWVGEWYEPGGEGPFTSGVEWVKTVLMLWIPIYMLLSLKRVYRQGWGLTLAKFSAVGISYMVLLGFATAFVAVLSFVLL
jgi:hypothetical protein